MNIMLIYPAFYACRLESCLMDIEKKLHLRPDLKAIALAAKNILEPLKNGA